MRARFDRHACACLMLLACAAYSFSFMPFLSDDSLISLRYAQRLLEGKGLTWTEGMPVEGYSNLAWVLMTALLGWMGIDLIVAVRLLGAVCTVVAALGIAATPTQSIPPGTTRARLGAVMLYGLSGTTAVWAIGGLEQPLVAACLAWAMVGVLRISEARDPAPTQAIMPGMALALMCLTRPDSPLFVVASCMSLMSIWHMRRQKTAWRVLIVLVGLPLAAYAMQTVFRLAYYDALVANTALVKARPSFHHFLHGGLYVVKGSLSLLPLIAAGLWSAWALYRAQRMSPVLVLATPMLLWLAYLTLIGGDIFPAFRHFTPVVVLLAMLVSAGAGLWLASMSPTRAWAWTLGGAAALLGCQWLTPDVHASREESWEWSCKDLALMLRNGFAPREPLMAVSAAGCLPYWSGWPAIDMLGLNDPYLPRHPPSTFGSGYLGHELGSGPYVFARRPDMIVYHIGMLTDPFLTGRELADMPEFRKLYTPVWLHVRAPATADFLAVIWMNRESKLIGMRREGPVLRVPGYLLNGHPQARVHLREGARLVTNIPPGSESWVNIPSRLLPSGKLTLKAQGSQAVSVSSHRTEDGGLRVTMAPAPGHGDRADDRGNGLDIEELVITGGN